MNNKRKREGKDDFENYLIKSGFYDKSVNKEMTEEEKAIEEEEKKRRKKEEEIINKNKDKIDRETSRWRYGRIFNE